MINIKRYLTNLGTQLKESFSRTQKTIDGVVFTLQCESEILMGGEVRYALAHDGSLGVQPTMKDSIRKPVVFSYNPN